MEILDRVRKMTKNDETRVNMLATMMGCSGTLTEFVIKNHNVSDIPFEVRYAMIIVAGNLRAFISGSEDINFVDKDQEPAILGEQAQERIYRRMKEAIIDLYNHIKEEEEDMKKQFKD